MDFLHESVSHNDTRVLMLEAMHIIANAKFWQLVTRGTIYGCLIDHHHESLFPLLSVSAVRICMA